MDEPAAAAVIVVVHGYRLRLYLSILYIKYMQLQGAVRYLYARTKYPIKFLGKYLVTQLTELTHISHSHSKRTFAF